MSSTSTPFGALPLNNTSNSPTDYATMPGIDAIASGYNTAIYYGSPVKWNTSGNLVIASTAEDFIGFFAGVRYIPAANQLQVQTNYWVANTTYLAGSCYAYIWTNPNLLYAIQANGSLAQTSVGDQADFVNPGSGNATIGISNAQISTTLVGAGSSGQLRIMGLYPGVDNAWGDSYTTVVVQIARSQYVASKNAI